MSFDNEIDRLMTVMLNLLAERYPRLSKELTAKVNQKIGADSDKAERKKVKLALLHNQSQAKFSELVGEVGGMEEFATIASNPKTSKVFTYIFELSEEARMPGSFESRYNRQYEDES